MQFQELYDEDSVQEMQFEIAQGLMYLGNLCDTLLETVHGFSLDTLSSHTRFTYVYTYATNQSFVQPFFAP
jgi:hypothetical protein